mmetsp:Transcript_3013/g.4592  ORF Transcript_3013/g.4592 Transcript_3013/m.4592 type:complete len:446 (+) Transcript_3013:155-1492(+)
MLYINQKGKWVSGPVASTGDVITHRIRKTIKDVWWYYANLIDYFRILMAVVALVLILHAPEWKFCIATLIFGSVLLDWIDGPIARHYNQSTVIGCGWDWLADLLAQYCLAIWCVHLGSPIVTFVVLFTVVEISTGLFDFAVSAQSIYPSQDTSKLPWYFVVEEWLTPAQSYNNLGTACWLINTLYPISYCLNMPLWVCYALAPFAMLYAWHETCQLIFIVENWRETTASYSGGVAHMRSCNDNEVDLLKSALDNASKIFNFKTSAQKEIYWANLFHNGKTHPEWLASKLHSKVESFTASLLKEFYSTPRVILSYGFIVSPKNGTLNQRWHQDYGTTVSNLMIPMTMMTQQNATQFVRHPDGPIKSPTEDLYFGEPHTLFSAEKTDHLEVCQVVTEPYSILKLFPGCIHRGIANKEDYDRILFFVSTSETEIDLQETFNDNHDFQK